MTKTCGNCYFFEVYTGPNGGRLTRQNAPGDCGYKIILPLLPMSIARHDFARSMPLKKIVNRNKDAEKCPTWHTSEKQMPSLPADVHFLRA